MNWKHDVLGVCEDQLKLMGINCDSGYYKRKPLRIYVSKTDRNKAILLVGRNYAVVCTDNTGFCDVTYDAFKTKNEIPRKLNFDALEKFIQDDVDLYRDDMNFGCIDDDDVHEDPAQALMCCMEHIGTNKHIGIHFSDAFRHLAILDAGRMQFNKDQILNNSTGLNLLSALVKQGMITHVEIVAMVAKFSRLLIGNIESDSGTRYREAHLTLSINHRMV